MGTRVRAFDASAMKTISLDHLRAVGTNKLPALVLVDRAGTRVNKQQLVVRSEAQDGRCLPCYQARKPT